MSEPIPPRMALTGLPQLLHFLVFAIGLLSLVGVTRCPGPVAQGPPFLVRRCRRWVQRLAGIAREGLSLPRQGLPFLTVLLLAPDQPLRLACQRVAVRVRE